MKEVTDLIPVGKGKSEVWLDGEFAFVLYRAELNRLDIHKGSSVSEAELESIYKDVLCPRAFNRLLYLLGSRDMTRRELEDKLISGKYPKEARDYALGRMEEYGYVNDESYVRRYIECYRGRKSIGYIRQALMKKGIPRELIAEALTESEEQMPAREQERELIKNLLEKRRYDPQEADRKEKQRMYAYLSRRGFKGEDISAVMFDLT